MFLSQTYSLILHTLFRHNTDKTPSPAQIVTERITLSSRTQPAKKIKPSPTNKNATSTPPAYILSISYVRSANAGKSLLAKGKTKVERGYTAFFNEQGTMDQEAFEKWVGEAVESAMDGKNA